ncbi:hypothetical protein M3223_13495 [Paenibacillus pasadenensis]|uniref:hypothetical protein n=1 Tax=Paenibacillus pasadenensis TaxID=217090 RepID=UPI00203A68C0|nr:hypothetical protein [Paenibacillus pasadenensis]MCM3748365.1 hypothetical protein [Paenibacillus pasadenensis]
MNERLLIKLVTGRVLVDTAEHRLPLLVEEGGRGWVLSVGGLSADAAEYIGANVDQLNFFYFVEDAEEKGLVRKYWLYDLDRPDYQFDPATGEAVFGVDSRVAYTNERV